MQIKREVSLVMITYNDYDLAKGTVLSCKGLVEEVLIVDQSDNEEEAKKIEKLADFYIKTTPKGFADPDRKYAYMRANKEWILALDTDERLSPELKSWMSQWRKDKFRGNRTKPEVKYVDSIDIFWFKFRNIVISGEVKLNLSTVLGDDPHPRLFKNGSLVWPDKAHTFPKHLSSRICNSPLEIIHTREWEHLKATHERRSQVIDPMNREIEIRFLTGVKNMIDIATSMQGATE